MGSVRCARLENVIGMIDWYSVRQYQPGT